MDCKAILDTKDPKTPCCSAADADPISQSLSGTDARYLGDGDGYLLGTVWHGPEERTIQHSSLETLPNEILSQIFQELDINSLWTLASQSCYLRMLVRSLPIISQTRQYLAASHALRRLMWTGRAKALYDTRLSKHFEHYPLRQLRCTKGVCSAIGPGDMWAHLSCVLKCRAQAPHSRLFNTRTGIRPPAVYSDRRAKGVSGWGTM